jgi:hypothetical protein
MAEQRNGARWTPEEEQGLGGHMQQAIRRESSKNRKPDAERERDTGDGEGRKP